MNKEIYIPKDAVTKLPNVTRVEVIDEQGRSYVNWNNSAIVELSLQDDARTLKIFISHIKK